jgi:hypothetical protein
VGEWLQDPTNPNYGALDGVKRFKLVDEDPARRKKPSAGGKGKGREEDENESEHDEDEDGCWYYIKMRCVTSTCSDPSSIFFSLSALLFPLPSLTRADTALPTSFDASL